MSYNRASYDVRRRHQSYGASRQRTAFGYWVPLTVTVTAAAFGVAAWIWRERRDDHDEDDPDGYAGSHDRPPRPPPGYGDVGPGQTAFAPGAYPPASAPASSFVSSQDTRNVGVGVQESRQAEDQSVMARMSGALRRTPSPQQIFDEAGRRFTAGVAAAGAVVGGALSSIREEDKRDYEDHSRWSEEAEAQPYRDDHGSSNATSRLPGAEAAGVTTARSTDPTRLSHGNGRRRTVAFIVSADTQHHGHQLGDATYLQEHASILSHLPEHVGDDCQVFVLIYAPDLKQHPLATGGNSDGKLPAGVTSATSSFSNIGHEDIPGANDKSDASALESKTGSQSSSQSFNALYRQAQALVDNDTMIMPFNTPTGYLHLLRHIAPDVVYIQATLSGHHGDAVKKLSGWVGQTVLVVGDETGHGGLVDSEDERGATGETDSERWWHNDSSIGLGKGIEVVEGLRVGEDYRRRVRGHD